MSLTVSQTPQKPLPGTYLNTPALNRRFSLSGVSQFQSIFRSNSSLVKQAPQSQPTGQQHQQPQQQPQSQHAQQAPQNANAASSTANTSSGLSLVERAARTINVTLEEEGRFPPLENYITRMYERLLEPCI